jgi:spore coat protein A
VADPANSSGVVHLHGAHVDPKSDGFSMDWITNGQQTVYRYPNKQKPLTMWYHDHVMTRTRVNVYAGLLGIHLLAI